MIRQIKAQDTKQFWQAIDDAVAFEGVADKQVVAIVDEVLAAIKGEGDKALLEYTERFDRHSAASVAALEVTDAEIAAARKQLEPSLIKALEQAAERIIQFHERQKASSWQFTDQYGSMLGQRVTPLDRAGLYVPGGQAAYPSSVLMNAIPAKVAGVGELIMVSPAMNGAINPLVLVAAKLAGVDRVFKIGGAQAVAALGYGTETVPRVDKIVGPGNVYVAAAKRALFGRVGLDMIAGPSEILIYTDGGTPADWIALDLFSQAEHDADAQAILIAPNAAVLADVAEAIERLLPQQPRASIIEQSLRSRALFIEADTSAMAAEVINRIAPEHLELSIENAQAFSEQIRHAGAIFMGRYTAEALGDYCAGPNHVLPTSQTARFSSPLGVYDFQKRTSLIDCTLEGAQALAKIAGPLAQAEGLYAHQASAEARLDRQSNG